MSRTTVNVNEAETHFSKLLARVEKGERITVTRAGKPLALLIPAEQPSRGNRPGGDPLLNLDQFGSDGPGPPIGNTELDGLFCGR